MTREEFEDAVRQAIQDNVTADTCGLRMQSDGHRRHRGCREGNRLQVWRQQAGCQRL